jgi:hypothetical protein
VARRPPAIEPAAELVDANPRRLLEAMEEWMLRCRTIDLRSSFTARFASAFADFREPVLVRPLLVAAEAGPAVRRGAVTLSTSIFRP